MHKIEVKGDKRPSEAVQPETDSMQGLRLRVAPSPGMASRATNVGQALHEV